MGRAPGRRRRRCSGCAIDDTGVSALMLRLRVIPGGSASPGWVVGSGLGQGKTYLELKDILDVVELLLVSVAEGHPSAIGPSQ